MVDYSSLPAYAGICLRALNPVASERDGWLCHCPNPRHGGDARPSLRVTVGEGGRLLVVCRAGCPTPEVLEAAGLSYRDLHPQEGDSPLDAVAQEASELAEADADARDEAYSLFLSLLRLSPAHRKSLEARGLPADALAAGRYRTLDAAAKASAPGKLFKKLGDALYSVPGFKPGPKGASLSTGVEGLVVPCRDSRGRVVALKVRRDEGDPRYVYFSGADSVSSGAHLHHPASEVEGGDYVVVTEGELKADVSQALLGRTCLGVPGVALWRRAVDELASLRKDVVVAFDWADVASKYSVFSAARDFVGALRDVGLDVSCFTWPQEGGKGLDDCLSSGVVPVRVRGEDLTRQLAALERAHNHVAVPQHVAAASLVSGESGWQPAPFPSWVFPPALETFVNEVATSKQAPVDFPGVALLTVAASALGASRALRVKGDWLERPCLYSIIVAEAGSRKTPSLKTVMAPVYRLEADLAESPAATKETIYVADATMESLGNALKSNHRGLLMMRDEASGFFSDFNKYRGGKGSDRQMWLSFWSAEPWKIDRKSDDSRVHIACPVVNILGGIQPSLLSDLDDKQGREDGLTHRFDFSMPPAQTYPGWNDRSVSEHSQGEWAEAYLRLRSYAFDSTPEGRPLPRVLKFSKAALAEYVRWYDSHHEEIRNMPDAKLKSPWAKFEAKCARYALVLRMIWTEDPDGAEDVQACDVERAIALVDYYKSHARGVYSRLKNTAEDDYVVRLLHLASTKADQQVSVREAMRALKLHTKSDTLAVFKRAADLGKGSTMRVSLPNGRPGEIFTTREE